MAVHCQGGGRSQKAVALLRQAGFAHVQNLTGGILAWIRDVDPHLTPY